MFYIPSKIKHTLLFEENSDVTLNRCSPTKRTILQIVFLYKKSQAHVCAGHKRTLEMSDPLYKILKNREIILHWLGALIIYGKHVTRYTQIKILVRERSFFVYVQMRTRICNLYDHVKTIVSQRQSDGTNKYTYNNWGVRFPLVIHKTRFVYLIYTIYICRIYRMCNDHRESHTPF